MSKRSYRKGNSALSIAIITLVFVLVISTGITAVLSKGFKDWSFWPWIETPVNNTASVSNVKLAMSSAVVTEDNVSRSITATVYPETATNKAVDWSIAWEDEQRTESVTDYVTVTSEDGSTTATVTCYQAFEGNIIVTVTTRVSSRSDSIVVSFVGNPTSLSIQTDIDIEENGSYSLLEYSTYIFNVEANNPFDSVRQDLEYEISCYGSGLVYVGYYMPGSDDWANIIPYSYNDIYSRTVNVSIVDSTVVIETLCSMESFFNEETGEKTYSVNVPCYLDITVTEKTTGLSETFTIRVVKEVVSSVDIEDESIEF